MTPLVSVVIPVYNDSRRLEACLQALARQTYPKPATQIIVVDNASQEDIRAVVARYPGAEYAHESARGPAAARNKGAAAARGEILAFTDADCLPDENWLEKGVALLAANPEAGLVGGRVDIFCEDPERPTYSELYDSVTYLDQKRHVEQDRFAATANMFTFRRVWDAVGGFDQSFPTASGEDTEWGMRVHARGYPLLYGADARVAHPAEPTFQGLCRKAGRLERGMIQLRAQLPGAARHGALRALKPLYFPLVLCLRMAREPRLKSFGDKAMVSLIAVYLYYFKLGIRAVETNAAIPKISA